MKLKSFTLRKPIQAIKVTRANYKELMETVDCGDGCIADDPEDAIGAWLVLGLDGTTLWEDGTFRDAYKEKRTQ